MDAEQHWVRSRLELLIKGKVGMMGWHHFECHDLYSPNQLKTVICIQVECNNSLIKQCVMLCIVGDSGKYTLRPLISLWTELEF